MIALFTYTEPLFVCRVCLRNGDVASKKLKLQNPDHRRLASIIEILLLSCRLLNKSQLFYVCKIKIKLVVCHFKKTFGRDAKSNNVC